MSDEPMRQELFVTLAHVLCLCPQLRVGQLICNMASRRNSLLPQDATDDALLANTRGYSTALTAGGVGTDGIWRGDPASDEPTRAAVLAAFAELAREHPHRPVGRLLCDLADRAGSNVWDVEDDQLLAAARGQLTTKAAGPTPLLQ